jgi:hypothetical protein
MAGDQKYSCGMVNSSRTFLRSSRTFLRSSRTFLWSSRTFLRSSPCRCREEEAAARQQEIAAAVRAAKSRAKREIQKQRRQQAQQMPPAQEQAAQQRPAQEQRPQQAQQQQQEEEEEGDAPSMCRRRPLQAREVPRLETEQQGQQQGQQQRQGEGQKEEWAWDSFRVASSALQQGHTLQQAQQQLPHPAAGEGEQQQQQQQHVDLLAQQQDVAGPRPAEVLAGVPGPGPQAAAAPHETEEDEEFLTLLNQLGINSPPPTTAAPARPNPVPQELLRQPALQAGPSGTGPPGAALGDDGCVVCMEAPRQTVLVPCGHHAMCVECTRGMLGPSSSAQRRCPVCRVEVRKPLCVRLPVAKCQCIAELWACWLPACLLQPALVR